MVDARWHTTESLSDQARATHVMKTAILMHGVPHGPGLLGPQEADNQTFGSYISHILTDTACLFGAQARPSWLCVVGKGTAVWSAAWSVRLQHLRKCRSPVYGTPCEERREACEDWPEGAVRDAIYSWEPVSRGLAPWLTAPTSVLHPQHSPIRDAPWHAPPL
ncbi:hypothetical protein NDU88_006704 [Pleurodeles waltl]|uniref:Uncharacterized protein n=1 Tax=Pleurodeles waltl TaxID=8319 RepID=A0AAV7ULS2_PLEWA|nr:hypothetical protein NDU88_006704 [Pleurodeles waltl]